MCPLYIANKKLIQAQENLIEALKVQVNALKAQIRLQETILNRL